MSGIHETPTKTYVAGEAIEPFRGVTINTSGQAVYAGAGVPHDGISEQRVASADPLTVRLRNAQGTRKVCVVTASGSVGDKLYAAASGKASKTKAGRALYEALEAWTAANSIIEVQPLSAGDKDACEGTQTATAGDASNGYIDITHGLPFTPTQLLFTVISSAGAVRVITSAVADGTKVRLTVTSLAANDVASFNFS